ncbi:MAG: IclR family transcriptional regulator [Proteobacteria bacterium]|nr:IclR family transcriptional regulator [Pseudomonadota bacterium]
MMRGVQRTLAVFECFDSKHTSRSLQEIVNALKLPKSTTFRIVASLVEAGYLVRLPDQDYCLSFKFVRLGGLVGSTLNIRAIARPVMERLAKICNETVTLNTVSENQRICLDVVDTPSALMSVSKPGEHLPLVEGSTAKMLIAWLPAADQRIAIAAAAKLRKLKRSEFAAEIARIHEQGYAVTHGERVRGLTAVSAPIQDLEREGHYCLTITGPQVRMQSQVKNLIRMVIEAAADISRQLGAQS